MDFVLGSDEDDVTRHVRRKYRQFSGEKANGAFADDDAAVSHLFIGIVWQIEKEFCPSEDQVQFFVNGRAVVRCPMHYSVELLVEVAWSVDECVHMTGFIAGTGVNQKVKRAVAIGSNGVEKMITTAQITQGTFIRTEMVSNLIPAWQIQIFSLKT